ncbi:hypothetical protein OG21DRAFT_1076063 [Imleria badia]|nr:hypothetical protein OG21DRAFT_1076063 [Imleria badia]
MSRSPRHVAQLRVIYSFESFLILAKHFAFPLCRLFSKPTTSPLIQVDPNDGQSLLAALRLNNYITVVTITAIVYDYNFIVITFLKEVVFGFAATFLPLKITADKLRLGCV